MSVVYHCSRSDRWSTSPCDERCDGEHLLRHVGPERIVGMMNAVTRSRNMIARCRDDSAIYYLDQPLRWMTAKDPS